MRSFQHSHLKKTMITLSNIKALNIEAASSCTARCPFCSRQQKVRDYGAHRISFSDIQKLPKELMGGLRRITFAGNFGDLSCNPEMVDIARYIKGINKKIILGGETNGAAQKRDWWSALGTYYRDGMMVFAVDGLSDTHALHRAGTDFTRLSKICAHLPPPAGKQPENLSFSSTTNTKSNLQKNWRKKRDAINLWSYLQETMMTHCGNQRPWTLKSKEISFGFIKMNRWKLPANLWLKAVYISLQTVRYIPAALPIVCTSRNIISSSDSYCRSLKDTMKELISKPGNWRILSRGGIFRRYWPCQKPIRIAVPSATPTRKRSDRRWFYTKKSFDPQ